MVTDKATANKAIMENQQMICYSVWNLRFVELLGIKCANDRFIDGSIRKENESETVRKRDDNTAVYSSVPKDEKEFIPQAKMAPKNSRSDIQLTQNSPIPTDKGDKEMCSKIMKTKQNTTISQNEHMLLKSVPQSLHVQTNNHRRFDCDHRQFDIDRQVDIGHEVTQTYREAKSCHCGKDSNIIINTHQCVVKSERYSLQNNIGSGSGVSSNHRKTRSTQARSSLYLGILLLLMSMQGIWCLEDNNILQLNIPTEEPVIDPNTVCKTYPELSPKQYRLCAKYPDVVASAIQGIQIAIHECQYQMKEHRWNCSSLEKKNKNPHSSPMLRKGYRESAFAYALSSAGVTHQVSKACSMGKLKSCGCDMSNHGEVRDKFEWGGCSHNVEFGDKFAKKFTLARDRARDIHGRINLHNNRAGRMVILKNVKKQCKCHGMSGSCEIKTCWKVSPEFRLVGDILKQKFEKANRVNINNETDKKSRRRLIRKQRKTELVYYEKSPNFCDPNPRVDSLGTTGRFCNKSSKGSGDCDTLCCGRGYNTMKVRRTERCNCKFHWCCYVVCQTCVYNEWVTVCK